MKRLSFPLIALVLAVVGVLEAKHVKEAPAYFDPATVDFKTLLPAPPDGPATQKEIESMLQMQAVRTPEEVARIQRAADHLDVYLFDTVLGPKFNAKDMPQVDAFFTRVSDNDRPVVDQAKDYWKRPRPYVQDKRIQPACKLPGNASYPSGHSAFATVDALILAELVPRLKEQILARGRQIGDDRVIGGVHFPSDITAGRTLGEALFAKLMASPAFRVELQNAKLVFDFDQIGAAINGDTPK